MSLGKILWQCCWVRVLFDAWPRSSTATSTCVPGHGWSKCQSSLSWPIITTQSNKIKRWHYINRKLKRNWCWFFLFRVCHRTLHDWSDGNRKVEFGLRQQQEAQMSGRKRWDLCFLGITILIIWLKQQIVNDAVELCHGICFWKELYFVWN